MAYAKLVIKVPEELLEYFANHNCMSEDGWFSHSSILLDAFRNGTPLLEVLDKIKTEIKEEKKVENIPEDVEMWDYIRALDRTLSIIDKCRAEQETEK